MPEQRSTTRLPLSHDDPRHGSQNAYTNYACRCDRCRAAFTEWKRLNNWISGRHMPRAEEAALRSEKARERNAHGTPQRYWIGCRCQMCKTAEAAYQRGRREARKVALDEQYRDDTCDPRRQGACSCTRELRLLRRNTHRATSAFRQLLCVSSLWKHRGAGNPMGGGLTNGSRQPLHRYVCSSCGYDGFKASETRCTIGEVSVAWFCPACGGALFRDDPLGKIEAEHFGGEALGA